ncbi:putative metabolite transport protein YaaU [Pseudomonas reidholzensis]|uniref:Putative metabolite transport protein YaaU n=1 Tax=Pseudomonas reidholzensis TaxID=1785162 RepID=A0A383RY05_9PSED|nr:MFS transporter [Pseudomonas reidholzensis]SYX91633.1 putative metabolite transport protein YaaU [Pseudomonas reidholzensis]
MRSTIQPVMIDDVAINAFHQLLTLRTGLGWVMVGYILSIIGVATLAMSEALQLSGFWQGMVAAMALLGVFAGGFFGGWLTDRIGRQKLVYAAPAIVLLTSLAMFWVEDGLTLSILRLLCGLAVGIEYTAAGSLLTEFIPQKSRGSRLSLLTVLWFVGAALAYIVGNVMMADASADTWRNVMASPAILGALLLVIRLGTPESPRWLLSKGRREEAEQVIRKVYGDDFSLRNITDDSASGKAMSFIGALRAGYGKRIFFVVSFWACAVIPLFAVYAFVPKLFSALNLTGNLAAYGSVGITLMMVLGCIIATWMINYVGRRTIIIHSFLWSGLSLLGLALLPDAEGWLVLTLFGAYGLFIGGAQVLEFVYPNELFPTEIRAFAVGMGASLAAFSSAIGTWLVPISLEQYGIGSTLLAATLITMLGLAVSLVLAPETRSMSLQEAAVL